MTGKPDTSTPNHPLPPQPGSRRVKTLPSFRRRVTQTLSYGLIIAGFVLAAIGLLIPLKNEWDLFRNPPPPPPPEGAALSLSGNPLPAVNVAGGAPPDPTASPTFTPTPT
ncbi:MAG: hypothetical protein ACE5G8_06005, partial [Anaerolineae bacterium]